MNTTWHPSLTGYHHKTTDHVSIWSRFISWCNSQENHRFLWVATGLMGHGCLITPLTLMAVMVSGNSMFLWALVIGAMTMTLVTILAALPTKITIPVLFLSILIDLGVVVSSIMISLPITVQ